MEWLSILGSLLGTGLNWWNTEKVNKTNKEIAEQNIASQNTANYMNMKLAQENNNLNRYMQAETNATNLQIANNANIENRRAVQNTNDTNLQIAQETNAANQAAQQSANQTNIDMQQMANDTNLEIMRQTNKANMDIANQNLQFQREAQAYNQLLNRQMMEREDNAVQRHVNDLRMAGLSPLYDMAGAGAGGQVTPVGALNNSAQMQGATVNAASVNPSRNEAPTMQASRAEAAQMGMTRAEYERYQAVENRYQERMVNFDSLQNIGNDYIKATQAQQELENERAKTEIMKQEAATKKLQVINSHNEEMMKITTMQKKAEQEITNMIQANETEKKKIESMDIDNKEKEARISKINEENKSLETQREATRAGIIKTMSEIKSIDKEEERNERRMVWEGNSHYYSIENMKKQIAQTEIETEVRNIMLQEIKTKGSYNQQEIEMRKKELTEKYWELGERFINDTWSNAWKSYDAAQKRKHEKNKWNFWKAFKK